MSPRKTWSEEPVAAEPGPAPAFGEPAAGLLPIFLIFLRVGGLSFGGGSMGWVHREVVMLRGWLSEADFLSALTVSQVLPGANIANMSVGVGLRLAGLRGAVVALLGLLLVPSLAVVALSQVYGTIRNHGWAERALDGVAASAIGLILVVALRGTKASVRGVISALAFGSTFVSVGILEWPMVPVVFSVGTASVLATWWVQARRERGAGDA